LNSLSFSFNYVSAFLFDSPFLSDIHPTWRNAFIVPFPVNGERYTRSYRHNPEDKKFTNRWKQM